MSLSCRGSSPEWPCVSGRRSLGPPPASTVGSPRGREGSQGPGSAQHPGTGQCSLLHAHCVRLRRPQISGCGALTWKPPVLDSRQRPGAAGVFAPASRAGGSAPASPGGGQGRAAAAARHPRSPSSFCRPPRPGRRSSDPSLPSSASRQGRPEPRGVKRREERPCRLCDISGGRLPECRDPVCVCTCTRMHAHTRVYSFVFRWDPKPLLCTHRNPPR